MDPESLKILLASVITLGGIGFICGFGLAYAANKFRVEKDPRIAEILQALPGANCGACGYPSCAAAAEAIAKGVAGANLCKIGGAETTQKIVQILGVTTGPPADKAEKMLAVVQCGAGPEACDQKSIYVGEPTCAAASLAGGGFLMCDAGCLGFGDCVKACQFGAIHHESGRVPIILREKCTACEKCVAACPKNLIKMYPARQEIFVLCNTADKGAEVKKYCRTGCIACRICVNKCPEQAISMDGRIPEIDPEKCRRQKVCIAACPQKTIQQL
ncbi:MAG: RnfABCDGE type electron transport complex subunit B [Candidatus Margulisiibacteriota bacterium]